MREMVCKTCRRLVKGSICPVCKDSELSKGWKGVAVIFDTDSEIAKVMGITSPGRYAIKIR